MFFMSHINMFGKIIFIFLRTVGIIGHSWWIFIFFIQIDAITVREKLCGVGTKIIFMSETNFVLIKFQSDFMNSALGFLMKVSQIAGKYRPSRHMT